jgi:hypothetical protein
MHPFAAALGRFAWAVVVSAPAGATHGCLTPAARVRALDNGVDVAGMHLVVAGDRLTRVVAGRAVATGARVNNYYGVAEVSPGGFPSTALPSVSRGRGTIVESLTGPVTVGRTDVGLVIIEHGVADLRGTSGVERRERLLAFASPEYALHRAPATRHHGG